MLVYLLWANVALSTFGLLGLSLEGAKDGKHLSHLSIFVLTLLQAVVMALAAIKLRSLGG